ncbi:MAG: 16S rRNA (uracil(1498)-N(3))-methyltransferase [Fusobacterium necrophorum]|nr:16S rRNA (uracil(1498)-N(3))-methyltransferase [Fusobacterium necrophorum]
MISVIIERKEYLDEIILEKKEDLHHLLHVFRLEVGDKVRAVDGDYEYICEIQKIIENKVHLQILEKKEDAFSLSVEIDAAICLIKNDKMDFCIQKLTELGIHSILPTIAKRCVVKLKEKKEKWNTIVKETMKQCQGVKPTQIQEIVDLKQLPLENYDLILLPYECEEEHSLKHVLRNGLLGAPKKILYIIGPEGGFEKEEIEHLASKGAKVVSLGKRILRAETAAIVVGGVLVHEFE